MDNNSIFRKEALERLSSPEQLDQLMEIVTPKSWLPVAALGGLLGCGLIWSIFGRIPVTTTGQGALVYRETPTQSLVGVAYFSAGEIAQIQPGMPVLLIPDVEGVQVSGGLMGEVETVSAPMVTTLEGARVTDLSTAQVEVLVEPNRDENGRYDWSTGRDEMAPMAGMPAIARVTLKERSPIAFVFPFLEQSASQ